MISSRISAASAILLAFGGLALLFASDVVMPALVPGIPPAGQWLGQLLAASWLAVAALDWLSRPVLLGGIYGRAVVSANAVLYFVAATSLVRMAAQADAAIGLRVLFVPLALFAGVYCWLLFRGPFERDFEEHRRAQQG